MQNTARRTSSTRLASVALAAAAVLPLWSPAPAAANGAASTRNIIFGSAAAIGGTLLVINHNRKVHQRYAEYDRRRAATAAARNEAEAAYESERAADAHEAAVADGYRRQTAYQHAVVTQQAAEIASLRHSLVLAKYGPHARVASAGRTVARAGRAPSRAVAASPRRAPAPAPAQIATSGWGSY